MRAPPLGLAKSIYYLHFRVMKALGSAGVPVPRTLALCEDSRQVILSFMYAIFKLLSSVVLQVLLSPPPPLSLFRLHFCQQAIVSKSVKLVGFFPSCGKSYFG